MDEFALDCTDDYMNESFFEFCYAVDAITAYQESTELYIEAIDDPSIAKKHRLGKDLQATADTTRKTVQLADTVIDAKASVYSAAVNLVFKVFGYAAKIFQFMAGKVTDLINGATRLASEIGRIPERVRATIRGDIKLYITVADIQLIYNQSLISKLDSAISELDLLTSGDTWGYMFHPNKIQNGIVKLKSNDIKHANNIKADAFVLHNTKFHESVVRLDIPENRRIYFSNDKIIKFTDLHGKQHEDSYTGALKQLLADLTYRKESIKNLEQKFGEKLNRTEVNQSWANMGPTLQGQIKEVLQSTSTILGAIGNMYKYIGVDMKTIESSVKKVLAMDAKDDSKKENKKADKEK